MKLTKTEWQVMNALWERHPATAREVAERLPADVNWAYTTIKTLLTRLLGKGAVSERKRANASVYQPLVSRQKARRSALRALADQAFDGAFGPLLHFLVEDQNLSPKQRRELIEALANRPKGRGERK
jgi:BlaI family penicillinase repressor